MKSPVGVMFDEIPSRSKMLFSSFVKVVIFIC